MPIRINKSENGFTLLEVAIVISIIGILLSLLTSALLTFVEKNRIETTEFRIEKIQESLTQYLNVNRKYPCPASRILGPDVTEFGKEVGLDCNAGTHAGTARNGSVRIGAVPNRSLNLPDEFAIDAWGRKFTYAVTEDLATANAFSADGGQIIVVDSGGNELVSPPSNPTSRAHYVVLSHGPTGDGAYPLNATSTPAVPCPASSQDAENCDNDSTFRYTLLNSDADLSDFYDDYISYAGQTTPILSIPPGAIIPFASTRCPDGGWAPYREAEGRFVYGFDPTPDTLDLHEMTSIILPGGATDSTVLSPGVTDTSAGDDEAIIPPFVTLLYCRKLP